MTLTPCYREVRRAGPALVSQAGAAFRRAAMAALVPCDRGAPPAKVAPRDPDRQHERHSQDYLIVVCSSNHSRYGRENCSKQHSRLAEVPRTATSPLLSATLPCPACPREQAPALACTLSPAKRFLKTGTTRTAMVQHDSRHQRCLALHRMQLQTATDHLGVLRLHGQPTRLVV